VKDIICDVGESAEGRVRNRETQTQTQILRKKVLSGNMYIQNRMDICMKKDKG
jgi:hypothetical protein